MRPMVAGTANFIAFSSHVFRSALPYLFLSAYCCLLFLYHLERRDLWSSHEGRAAQDAQTMVEDHAWGLPRLFDGRVEVQKPPLYYWLVALVSLGQGGRVDAWSERLPAALSGLGCVLVVYTLGRIRGRPLAGLIGAAVLATSVHFTSLARTGRVDMPLTFTVTLAVACGYLVLKGLASGKNSFPFARLTVYLALAAGILVKGPVGFVLPVAVLGIYLVVEGRCFDYWRPRSWPGLLHRLGVWWGLPLVAVLTVPWFMWANESTNGQYFQEFFWHHNFERGLGTSPLLRSHPWWHYGPLFRMYFLPWTPLLAVAGWSCWRRRFLGEDAEARLGLMWLGTIGLVLSLCAFKRADYLVPAYPGAALFLGCVAERWFIESRNRRLLTGVFSLILTACVGGWFVYVDWYLPRQEPGLNCQPFAEKIRRYCPALNRVAFFRNESHDLAFHVGRPLDVFVEWERLDALAARPEPSFVVMPARCVQEWPARLKLGCLEEVYRETGLQGSQRERPLVLLRTRPRTESIHAGPTHSAGDRLATDQCRVAGPQ